MKKLIDNDVSKQDEVADRIYLIITRDKQANIEVDRRQAYSDDDLILKLNGRLISQLAIGVSL